MNLSAVLSRVVNPSGVLEDARTRRLALQGALVALAIVVLVIAGWGWFRWQESRGEAALAQASSLVQQALTPQATPNTRARAMKSLEAVISEHSHFSGVPQAAYLLGNLRYAARQYPGARGAYEIALAKGGSGAVRTLSAVGIGYTWEAEKNYANATAAYETALKRIRPKDFLYEETLIALARAQNLGGQPAAAVETYQRLLKDVPESRRADDLKTRLAALKSRAAK